MKQQNDEIPDGYARVTEVLAPFCNFDHIDPKTLANAADRGTRVHDYCELHALGLFLPELDADCKNYVEAFKEWFDLMVTDVLETETRLNSPTYRVSGKFDMLVKLKGDEGLTIVDLKTPASPALSWQLQTAAYRLLLKECKGIPADRRISLMLPKHPGGLVKVCEYTDHEKDEALYIKAIELFRFFNG